VIAVINASPLIYLGKLGLLNYLPCLFSRVITSELVKNEVLDSKAPEFIALDEAFSKWLETIEVKDPSMIDKLVAAQIHEGEASIILIAKNFREIQKEPVLVIDDLAARDLARSLGFTIIGTIGIILKLVSTKELTRSKAKECLVFLVEETDFRISVKIYSRLLMELEE
jgi:hypothetical protein